MPPVPHSPYWSSCNCSDLPKTHRPAERPAAARRLWVRVSAIKVLPGDAPTRSENGREYLLEEESRGEAEVSRHL